MNTPLYMLIKGKLEQRIASGDLGVGERLPTEAELRSEYGVSRATAQRVLNELTDAGLAVRYRRRGTFVSDDARHQNLLRFINPESLQKGAPGRHKVLSAKVVQAQDAIVPMPGQAPETPVVEIVRIKYDGTDRPSTLEHHVLLFSVVPKILDEDLEHLRSFDYLREVNADIATCRVYLDPVVLGQEEAGLLECEPGQAAFVRRRHTRDSVGNLVEATVIITRPGSAQFYIEQTLQAPGQDLGEAATALSVQAP